MSVVLPSKDVKTKLFRDGSRFAFGGATFG